MRLRVASTVLPENCSLQRLRQHRCRVCEGQRQKVPALASRPLQAHPARTCLARVRRLEEHGYIVGYRAIVAPSGRGVRLEGWADIRFGQLTPELTRAFGRLVAAAPEIVEAHRIAGRSDYVVRFCAGDMSAWNAFRERLDALGGQAEAQFNLLVEAVK